MSEPVVQVGETAAALAGEFPGLYAASVVVAAAPGRSPSGLRARLAAVSDRFTGAQAVALRRAEVPHAYRVFFRHIGLDPDTTRTPVEAVALERLLAGGFPGGDRVRDACLLAVMETGVPVWALDEDRGAGVPGLRPAVPGERVGEGEHAAPVPAGRLVVADDGGPLAVLFADPAPDRVPTRATRRVRLLTVAVPGVSDLHVREALWLAAEAAVDD